MSFQNNFQINQVTEYPNVCRTGANTLANQNELSRIQQKHCLHMNEIQYRAMFKEKDRTIIVGQDSICVETKNVLGCVLQRYIVFGCVVTEIKRFVRLDSQREQFQIVIKSKSGISESFLYDTNLLYSSNNLRKTMLSEYDQTAGSKDSGKIWQYIWRECLKSYNSAKIQYLPEYPGWHKEQHGYKFWAENSVIDEIYKSPAIKEYQLRYCNDKSIAFAAIEFQNLGQLNSAECILLNIRLKALLGRLTGELNEPDMIFVYGNTAKTVATELLSVSANGKNIFNLNTDRISVIRDNVKKMRDDSAIFCISNIIDRSCINRITEISSWKQIGYIEGKKVIEPFIICMKTIAPEVVLDDCIIVNADSVRLQQIEKIFDVIQSLVISMIEESGFFFEKESMCIKDCNGEKKLLWSYRAMIDVLDRLLDSNGKKIITYLEHGYNEMKKQKSIQNCIVDIFRRAVETCEKLYYQNCKHISEYEEERVILYDDDYYYFSNDVLKMICETQNIDKKTIILVKQKLTELGLVKLYRSSGTHRRELNVDISIILKGERKYCSVFAVNQRLWNEPYGVRLHERRCH